MFLIYKSYVYWQVYFVLKGTAYCIVNFSYPIVFATAKLWNILSGLKTLLTLSLHLNILQMSYG